jgi:hypothetical protein
MLSKELRAVFVRPTIELPHAVAGNARPCRKVPVFFAPKIDAIIYYDLWLFIGPGLPSLEDITGCYQKILAPQFGGWGNAKRKGALVDRTLWTCIDMGST